MHSIYDLFLIILNNKLLKVPMIVEHKLVTDEEVYAQL